MHELIPKELQLLDQWVVAGPNKEPLNPRTGDLADVNNPRDWGTFAEAKSTGRKIGFVLSSSDPYTIVDLDDPTLDTKGQPDTDLAGVELRKARHASIMEALSGTYSEVSQSGRGMHIICRGSIPKGVRRDKVEVYSSQRYMICTGQAYNSVPVTDQQEILDILFEKMNSTGSTVDLVEAGQRLTDAQVYRMASNASNGDKFDRLCRGDLTGYPSQSEADLALLTILAFYTRSNEQVRRLFRYSKLGEREKALRDEYLDYGLRKIRAKQPPLVDLSKLAVTTPPVEPVKPPVASEADNPPPPPTVTASAPVLFPPGLVGEFAEYVLSTATRPVREIALGASLGLLAGIIGRSYNISESGLNQYIIVLARTGSGKEGAAKGIDSALVEMRKSIPVVDQFIGPASFASGQALIKTVDQQPCFVSVLGEVGLTLKHISDTRSNAAEQLLKKVLLDLYGKSGFKSILRPSVYSDRDKNTKMVQSPNVTILGEGTPDTFYDNLDESHIAEGLIPRFTILEYTGPRPQRNPHSGAPPDAGLVKRLTDLASIALNTQQNATCSPVTTNSAALGMLDAFDVEADKRMNSTESVVVLQLWNRAHLKALKVAALVAVGVNPHNPVVDVEAASWAIDFVRREIDGVCSRFQSGDVGTGESKQTADVLRAMEEYSTLSVKQRKNYRTPPAILDNGAIVPWPYLYKRLRQLKSFQQSYRSPGQLVEQACEMLIQADEIVQIPADQSQAQFNTRVKLYCLKGREG